MMVARSPEGRPLTVRVWLQGRVKRVRRWSAVRTRPVPLLARAMRSCRALLLLPSLLVSLPGCGWLFHKPRPDAEPRLANRPWHVRCAWVVGPDGQPASSPGPRADGWTWAADAEGRRVVVDGDLEDGFLRVEALRAVSEHDDHDTVSLPASARAVANLCASTIARQPTPAGTPELYAVSARRAGESVDVTMAFPFDPNGPLITRVVVLGDSLSDTGNLKDRLLVMPGSPYWLGRFADGPNWADWLAWNTGLAVQNHAFGGAVAVPHPDVPPANVIAAIEQGGQLLLTGSVERYVDDYLTRDLAPGGVARPWDTVYVLWAGANDYISKEPFTGDIGTLLDTPHGTAGYRHVVDQTVTALTGQIRRLNAAGARRFMVVTLPNLGTTPMVLHNTSYQPEDMRAGSERQGRLAAKLSELTTYHNTHLQKALAALGREMPGTTLIVADAERLLASMLNRRAPDGRRQRFDYGFDLTALSHEIGSRRSPQYVQDRCYRGSYLGSRDAERVCPEAGRSVFWDTVHPSSYTHCWIAWFIQTELVRAGLLDRVPTPEETRSRCEAGLEIGAQPSSGVAGD